MAERAIPDDLVEQNNQNVGVVVISYLLMFLYISLAIGYFPSCLHTRFTVGLSGIMVVICSLLISMGICSYFGLGMTMISTEVVPFLILAIGVDNMFIIVRAERTVDNSVTDCITRMAIGLSNVGPSICTAAICEVLSFVVGLMTDIPALQSFCLVAVIAVFCDFLFQITAFVAVVALDNQRIKNLKYDVIVCLKAERYYQPRKEIIKSFFKTHFTPLILKTKFQIFAAIVAVFFISFGIAASLNLSLGIDQKATVTTNSNIYNYFYSQEKLVDAGPPAYLVFRDIDYTDEKTIANIFDLMDVLSTKNDTIQKPIFSWLKSFKMFIMETGDWAKQCGTQGITGYPFSEQMRRFVKTAIDSECCSRYGICGEQFIKDVVFDSNGELELYSLSFLSSSSKKARRLYQRSSGNTFYSGSI